MQAIDLGWCPSCRLWWVAVDQACPECGKAMTATTSFRYDAAQLELQPKHSTLWHMARRKAGGTPRCDCGVRV